MSNSVQSIMPSSHPVLGKSFLGRALVVALPAAIITGVLFIGMRTMIQVDDFTPPEEKSVFLEAYLVPKAEKPITRPERNIMSLPDAKAPPPPAKLTSLISNPKVPLVDISGAAPAEYVIEKLKPIKIGSIMELLDKRAIPITPPMPRYPQRAIDRGLEGDCEVRLVVSPTGHPYNVAATCTDGIFKQSAERAVRKVTFSPLVKDGIRIEMLGAVYPIEFRLQQ
jgi:protein TonB